MQEHLRDLATRLVKYCSNEERTTSRLILDGGGGAGHYPPSESNVVDTLDGYRVEVLSKFFTRNCTAQSIGVQSLDSNSDENNNSSNSSSSNNINNNDSSNTIMDYCFE